MRHRYIQKITVSGNSAHVTMARPLLFALNLRPGDCVELIVEEGSDVLQLRPFFNRETEGMRSPGRINDDVPAPRR